MKQSLLLFFFTFTLFSAFAQQNSQYVEMMKLTIPKINYTNSVEGIQEAANQMERVAGVEKEDWLPSYYATIAYITLASKDMQSGGENIQGYVDKAKMHLAKAQELAPENSEVLTAQGYLSLAHIWINPMVNGAKYTGIAYGEFERAKKADPTNPRPHYLIGQNVYFTPEAFGGGKENAKTHLDKATILFEKFEPASEIAPDWGKESNDYFLSLYENQDEVEDEDEDESEDE